MAKARKSSPKKSLAKPLARVGDPLVLPSGQAVEPTPAGGVLVEKQDAKAHEYKPTKRRNLSELPAQPRVFNGIACVFVYSIFGVGDREIADAMRLKPEQVREIRKHPGYSELFDQVEDEFINAHSERLAARIASYGGAAVDTTAVIMKESKKDSLRLKAAENFVDWGGFSKKEQSKGGLGDALRIVVTKSDESTEITVDAIGGSNGNKT